MSHADNKSTLFCFFWVVFFYPSNHPDLLPLRSITTSDYFLSCSGRTGVMIPTPTRGLFYLLLRVNVFSLRGYRGNCQTARAYTPIVPLVCVGSGPTQRIISVANPFSDSSSPPFLLCYPQSLILSP